MCDLQGDSGAERGGLDEMLHVFDGEISSHRLVQVNAHALRLVVCVAALGVQRTVSEKKVSILCLLFVLTCFKIKKEISTFSTK